ncbi:MAG: 50S ribosomal protein L11 [Candidatus Bilamarchaeaceae archaeon]
MEKTVNAIVEGGKASAGPPLGPALAPLGVNIGQVIAKINEATGAFKGTKVPVTVFVDPATKGFRVEVGSPSASELIKKEAGVEKGAGAKDPVGNIPLSKIVELAKKKSGSSLGKSVKEVAKELVGTCVSMGIKVDNKGAKDFMKEIDQGKHDSVLKGE